MRVGHHQGHRGQASGAARGGRAPRRLARRDVLRRKRRQRRRVPRGRRAAGRPCGCLGRGRPARTARPHARWRPRVRARVLRRRLACEARGRRDGPAVRPLGPRRRRHRGHGPAGARVRRRARRARHARRELRRGVRDGVPDGVRAYEVDITDRAAIEQALREIESDWGVPHVLVNNAGLDSPPDAPAEEVGPFEDYPEASFDAVMDVNVKGTLLCCQVIGGAMAREGRGSIVNVVLGLRAPLARSGSLRVPARAWARRS